MPHPPTPPRPRSLHFTLPADEATLTLVQGALNRALEVLSVGQPCLQGAQLTLLGEDEVYRDSEYTVSRDVNGLHVVSTLEFSNEGSGAITELVHPLTLNTTLSSTYLSVECSHDEGHGEASHQNDEGEYPYLMLGMDRGQLSLYARSTRGEAHDLALDDTPAERHPNLPLD